MTEPVARHLETAIADLTDVDPATLPAALAGLVAQILDVDGAGISLHADVRVPLGASSTDAGLAERLQFTAGAGPCLAAAADGVTATWSWTAMEEDFPGFAAALAAQTPFRSVTSTPLLFPAWIGGRGALDCYRISPTADGPSRPDLRAVAAVVTDTLTQSVEPLDPVTEAPAWIRAEAARRRLDVWVAAGIVSVARAVSVVDAIAVIRARAFARDLTVDDLAVAIVNGDDDLSAADT